MPTVAIHSSERLQVDALVKNIAHQYRGFSDAAKFVFFMELTKKLKPELARVMALEKAGTLSPQPPDIAPLPQFKAGEEIDLTGGQDSAMYVRKMRDDE